MNHVIRPHTPPLVLPQPLYSRVHPSYFPFNRTLGFPLLRRTLSSPWFLIHWPPCFTQSTPLRQIIILSAVTKEMHTPSITMYKFSARGFGRVLIKKPFHSFSWEIIRLSSHQDATSIDPFSSSRKPIGEKINSRVFNHSPSGHQSIIKDISNYKKVCLAWKKKRLIRSILREN